MVTPNLPVTLRMSISVGLLLLVFTCNASESLGKNGKLQRSNQQQPNVIVLLADDLGYGELGCQGNTQVPTPNIDRLAKSGVRCTRAYVTAPNCSPSRAGFLSGRIPTRFGYEFNPIGARNDDPGTGLPQSEVTLAETLKAAGYTSGLIGKWHLGGSADYHPLRHGFDEFYGFLHEGHFYTPSPWEETVTMLRRANLPQGKPSPFWVNDTLAHSTHTGRNEPPYDANNPVLNAGQPVVEREYLTDAIARVAETFIERYQDSPFFLYVAFNAVHSPLQAKQQTYDEFESIADPQRRIFAAMLKDLDRAVGRIVNKVDELGLRDETLIIFFSDNGGPTRELTSSNLPLRGEKGSMYEGGLRIPFIVNWPAQLDSGIVFDGPVSSLDIYPAIAKLAGAEMPSNIDGKDLFDVLATDDEQSKDRSLFWRQGNRTAYMKGDWKLVDNRYASGSAREWELFDLSNDLSEENNLAKEEPEKLAEMIEEWAQLESQMSEPIFGR